jgi:CHAT domain-containing protein
MFTTLSGKVKRTMRFLCPFFVFLFFPLILNGQDDAKKKQLIDEYYEKAVSLTGIEKDSAFFYLNRALPFAMELRQYDDAMEILIQKIVVCGMNYDLKNYPFYLNEMEVHLKNKEVIAELDDYDHYRNRLIYEQGNYLDKLKDFNGAKTKFQELFKHLSKKDVRFLNDYDLSILVHTGNFLAGIYTDTGKYDLADNYFERSISFINKNEKADKNSLFRATNRLRSQLYMFMGKHDEADSLLKQVLSEYKVAYNKNILYKNSVLVVYQRIVDNLIQQDSLLKAHDYLDDSQAYLSEEDPFYKKALLLYGDIHSKLGQPQLALEKYRQALDVFLEYRQQKPHQDIAEVQGKIATFFLKEKNHAKGLHWINKALNYSGKDVRLADLHDNPDPNEVFSKRQLLQLLDLKLQLLQLAQANTNQEIYLKAAVGTAKNMMESFDVLKMEFESKIDKEFLAETAYPIFHRSLATIFDAYQENPTLELFDLALNISEKNKDFLLLEALRSANATQYGNVPKEVMVKEARFRAEISNLEKNLFDTTKEEARFSEGLFELKQEYYGFLDMLETEYPKYHDLKYQSKALDLVTIRNSLEDDEVVVSFSMTDMHLYALVLDRGARDFIKLPFDESDREEVRKFYKLLSSPTIADRTSSISDLGALLFEKILKRPLLNFESNNLTIIPDDVLHYLPFDVLVDHGSLLLQTKVIGYDNAITSFIALKEKKKSDVKRLLAFAPSFADQVVESEIRFEFGKLLYNDDEVNKIGSVYDGEIYTDQNATLENFNKNAPDFNVIHLATHASANDEFPDYSYLAFSEDGGKSNILYIKDLYNTTLNADMVTLSACQTGIGKLQKGQGMMSLSKGFFYAGAKSLVNTLWKINDKSSVKLMEFFYESLRSGKNKKEALRDAKLKYLETTDDNLLRHPYYWSAFVVSGDTAAISSTNYWWVIGGVVLFFMLLLILYTAMRNKKKY